LVNDLTRRPQPQRRSTAGSRSCPAIHAGVGGSWPPRVCAAL